MKDINYQEVEFLQIDYKILVEVNQLIAVFVRLINQNFASGPSLIHSFTH